MKSLANLEKYQILLASASPRRRDLLQQLGVEFQIAASIDVEENYPKSLPALEIASYLSRKKADAYSCLIDSNQLIITADTIVVNEGIVLGKPSTDLEAKEMLKKLSGHIHEVVTGVTITTAEKKVTFSAITEVEFAVLCKQEIDDYVEKFKPYDKAGAYGIQEWIGCIGVKNINGSFYNVMGLPLHRLYNELKQF